ncbi:hypothetical protein ACRRTK_015415 [Alexandromys fortis]
MAPNYTPQPQLLPHILGTEHETLLRKAAVYSPSPAIHWLHCLPLYPERRKIN